MPPKRHALTAETARKWADMAHLFFIDALSGATPLSLDRITFHGGTNLHLSWGSPRYSEDLDFLVSRSFGAEIAALMPKVAKRMQALATAEDPQLKIVIEDKTRDPEGLLNFRIKVSSPRVVGQVMAKAEFWQVTPEYLEGFDARFVQPGRSGEVRSRITQPLPVATLEAAFADKVVALANRPFLKWRDLFDLWWIAGQADISPQDQIARIEHHATAYRGTHGDTISDGLARFLERDPGEIFTQADPDLRKWLPKSLWEALNPDGVREMVDNAREIAGAVRALMVTDPATGERAPETADDENPGP